MKSKICLLFAFTLIACVGASVSAEDAAKSRVKAETIVSSSEIISLKAPLFTIPDTNKINMVLIPAGSFTMGSPKNELGHQADETQHQVTISKPFYMSETELSQKQFMELMHPDFKPFFYNFGPWGHSLPEIHSGGPWKAKSKYIKNPSNYAMENVSWVQAVKFCNKLTEVERKAGRLPKGYVYRLPTEAEWEYTCRAGTTGPFNNPAVQNLVNKGVGAGDDVFANTEANQWGLFRMHMGLFEWCLDDYAPYASDATDPLGTGDGQGKIARGGWESYMISAAEAPVKETDPAKIVRYIRSASRAYFAPGIPYVSVGIRPVLAPEVKYQMPQIPDDLLIEPME